MGKGDGRRPTAIDDAAFANNWCATWGHKMRSTSDICINCGKTAKEIMETEPCEKGLDVLRKETP